MGGHETARAWHENLEYLWQKGALLKVASLKWPIKNGLKKKFLCFSVSHLYQGNLLHIEKTVVD